MATITAVQPGGRFGVLDLAKDGQIKCFREKSVEDGGWINGGFMVLEPKVLEYIEGGSYDFSNVNHLKPLHRKISWMRISITVFGNAWIQ